MGKETLEQLAQAIADKQNEMRDQIRAKETVELEESNIARQILQLRINQKVLQDTILKASNNIKELNLDIKQLTAEFWNKKNI